MEFDYRSNGYATWSILSLLVNGKVRLFKNTRACTGSLQSKYLMEDCSIITSEEGHDESLKCEVFFHAFDTSNKPWCEFLYKLGLVPDLKFDTINTPNGDITGYITWEPPQTGFCDNWKDLLWQIMLIRAPHETPALVRGVNIFNKELGESWYRDEKGDIDSNKSFRHLFAAFTVGRILKSEEGYYRSALNAGGTDSAFQCAIYRNPPTLQEFKNYLKTQGKIYDYTSRFRVDDYSKYKAEWLALTNENAPLQERIDFLLGTK